MNNASAAGHMTVILGLLFKGFVIAGIAAIIFTLWVLIRKGTRKAVKEQGSKDYGSMKAKGSGLVGKVRGLWPSRQGQGLEERVLAEEAGQAAKEAQRIAYIALSQRR